LESRRLTISCSWVWPSPRKSWCVILDITPFAQCVT
jgi:hypothetical protein